jgi:hypothetical protein
LHLATLLKISFIFYYLLSRKITHFILQNLKSSRKGSKKLFKVPPLSPNFSKKFQKSILSDAPHEVAIRNAVPDVVAVPEIHGPRIRRVVGAFSLAPVLWKAGVSYVFKSGI